MTAIDIAAAPKGGGFSRRQALKVVAAAAAIPLGVAGYRMLGPTARFHTWNGESLGAVSSMMLWHQNAAFAERTLASMVWEVERLESVFSLYRPDSELSRLNRTGSVSGVSPDLIQVMTAARQMGLLSGGSFDPTVQPLWNVYESYFATADADPSGPPTALTDAAWRLIDYRGIDIGRRDVAFARQGMSVTLNGIAQGYITDRIADLLRNEGFEHVVVEIGESRVLGNHPDGRPWRVGLRDQNGATDRVVDLVDGAVALHGGYGTTFDSTGRNHHIFDPATGRSANRVKEVVVLAARAMDADALGVAIYVAGEERAASLLAARPGTRAIITRTDGSVVNLG